MKHLMSYSIGIVICLVAYGILLIGITACTKEKNEPQKEKTLTVTTVASDLHGLMGIEADDNGNVWVTESGTDIPDAHGNTHNDNGKVILITPDGKKYDAIINLSSFANIHTKELQGTSHILLDGGTLYILSGDYLYQVTVSSFSPGDEPINATTLTKEDIASIISQIPSDNNPQKDSHPYNLTKGPDGDLYITDAGANAVLHRDGANDYSILAEIPAVDNPMFPKIGGPKVQSVPTSIRYVDDQFLVTTLSGFPFPEGKAIIYQVTLSGDVSVYKDGFTMLVDQAILSPSDFVFVQFATSFNPATRFMPNTGALIQDNGTTQTVLVDKLNQPVGIKQANDDTWYVALLGDGSVLKVAYE